MVYKCDPAGGREFRLVTLRYYLAGIVCRIFEGVDSGLGAGGGPGTGFAVGAGEAHTDTIDLYIIDEVRLLDGHDLPV
jgi:hypothetical protein